MRASGSRPISRAAPSLPSSTAEAPSFSGEALPAVIRPPSLRKAGFSPASFCSVVPGRRDSSRVSSVSGT